MKIIQVLGNLIFKSITMSFAVLSYDDSARWIIFFAIIIALISEIDNFVKSNK